MRVPSSSNQLDGTLVIEQSLSLSFPRSPWMTIYILFNRIYKKKKNNKIKIKTVNHPAFQLKPKYTIGDLFITFSKSVKCLHDKNLDKHSKRA